MKKILVVNACVRPESRTMILARHLLSKLEGNVEELDLGAEDIKNLDLERLQERDRLAGAGDFSDDMFKYARQFRDADVMVMAAPYWDLSFPAAFKTYLEHVSVCELTFHYTEDARCEGICKAKRITYITTCGGFVEGANFGYEYIVGIAKMFGIPEVRFVAAEGLDIVGIDVQEQMDKARAQMAKLD